MKQLRLSGSLKGGLFILATLIYQLSSRFILESANGLIVDQATSPPSLQAFSMLTHMLLERTTHAMDDQVFVAKFGQELYTVRRTLRNLVRHGIRSARTPSSTSTLVMT